MSDTLTPSNTIQTSESLEMLTQAAAVVLSMVNIAGTPTLTPLAGGGNNRVFRVDVPAGALVLKEYFQHVNDPRDRLDAEFTFIKHVWAMGLRCMPRPVARLPLRQIALYSWIDGQPLIAGEITADHIHQAADFVLAINQKRDAFAGQSVSADLITEQRPCLSPASDACFTLAQHLVSIERRLSRLITLEASDEVDRQVIHFLENELTPAWRKVASAFRDKLEKQRLDLHAPVDEADRVISPSDFGFHNALRQADGKLAFIDFEYAGWDDPAKLVCDFFTQIAVPAGREHVDLFLDRFTACLKNPAAVRLRVEMLLPLYRIKWCCMALNCFLPVSADRWAFAQQQAVTANQKKLQFHKAQLLLLEHLSEYA